MTSLAGRCPACMSSENTMAQSAAIAICTIIASHNDSLCSTARRAGRHDIVGHGADYLRAGKQHQFSVAKPGATLSLRVPAEKYSCRTWIEITAKPSIRCSFYSASARSDFAGASASSA